MSKSYLKWVGGKGQLADELMARFPSCIDRYLEAFCGSAALFLHYYSRESSFDMFSEAELPPALLNDSNPFLIACHQSVMNHLPLLKKCLNEHDRLHESEDSLDYYKKIRGRITSDYDDTEEAKVQLASDFIYLNKTCFNGLWRVNSEGKNNVPFNGKTSLNLSASSKLATSSSLFRKYATFSLGDFRTFIDSNVKAGDFVFLDPPYVPVSDTASFTGYTSNGWSYKDDLDLKQKLEYIDSVGAKFMMTNSDSPMVYQLFGNWNIIELKAHRFVKALNGPNETREKVNETVTMNYDPSCQ